MRSFGTYEGTLTISLRFSVWALKSPDWRSNRIPKAGSPSTRLIGLYRNILFAVTSSLETRAVVDYIALLLLLKYVVTPGHPPFQVVPEVI